MCEGEEVLTKEYLQVQERKSKTPTFNLGPLLTKYFKKCFNMVPTANILSYIKKHRDITWSPKGELTLKGSVLPNTHVVDLIDALLRKRTSKPNGWKQFSKVLKDAPYKFIDNSDYRPTKKPVWEPY